MVARSSVHSREDALCSLDFNWSSQLQQHLRSAMLRLHAALTRQTLCAVLSLKLTGVFLRFEQHMTSSSKRKETDAGYR